MLDLSPYDDRPTYTYIDCLIESLNIIPTTVQHTWLALNLLSNRYNFCVISLDKLSLALNMSQANTRKRLKEVINFKINQQKIVEIYSAVVEKIDQDGNVLYKPNKKLELKNPFKHPIDKYGTKVKIGYKVKNIPLLNNN